MRSIAKYFGGSIAVGAVGVLAFSSANAATAPPAAADRAAVVSPAQNLAVLRRADDGASKVSMVGLAEQLAPSTAARAALGGPPADGTGTEIDLAAARKADSKGSVTVAPSVDRSRVCATSDLSDGTLGSCSLSKNTAVGQAGAFMSASATPGTDQTARTVGVVGDDVVTVSFRLSGGKEVAVKPVDNVVVYDGPTVAKGVLVQHADGTATSENF